MWRLVMHGSIHIWISLSQVKQMLQPALLNPKTSILIQKRHSYSRNPSSETSRDSENAFWNIVEMF